MDYGNGYGCIIDNMIAGNINNMIKFYDVKFREPGDIRYTEIYLQENYLNKTNLTEIDIRTYFHFCYNGCNEKNLTFFFKKHYKWDFITWRCRLPQTWL